MLKERSTRTDMSTLSSDRSRTFLLAPFVLLLLNFFFFCEFPPSPLKLPLTQPCGLEAHAPIYIYLQLCKNNIKKTLLTYVSLNKFLTPHLAGDHHITNQEFKNRGDEEKKWLRINRERERTKGKQEKFKRALFFSLFPWIFSLSFSPLFR